MDDFGWGLRPDGTYKGPGFDAVQNPDGSVVTELSVGPVDSLYPLMYKGILPWEKDELAFAAQAGPQWTTQSLWDIMDWATYQASLRKMQGLSPFWTPSDGAGGLPFHNLNR